MLGFKGLKNDHRYTALEHGLLLGFNKPQATLILLSSRGGILIFRQAFPSLISGRPPPPKKKNPGLLGLNFAGYVPLASQSPYPVIVYSVANFRPHLSHFAQM